MNEFDFWELQRTISFEFSKYVLNHPEVDGRIPDNALIVFQIKDNPEFNKWAKGKAKLRKEPDQSLVIVKVEKLLPPLETRLVNPQLELVSA